MTYRRFRSPSRHETPATVATSATLRGFEARSVAKSQVSQGVSFSGGANQPSNVATVAKPRMGISAEEWTAFYEERSAIREYLGGVSRHDAEALALVETTHALGPRPGTIH